MKIRTEQPADKSRVATLLARTYRGEGVKAIELAGAMRRAAEENAAATASLVAENDSGDDIQACAFFAPVQVGNQPDAAMVLAAFGFDTKQEVDIQSCLDAYFDQIKEQGHSVVLMQGDIDMFRASGFQRTREVGMDIPNDDGSWLVKNLTDPQSPLPQGVVDLPAYLK